MIDIGRWAKTQEELVADNRAMAGTGGNSLTEVRSDAGSLGSYTGPVRRPDALAIGQGSALRWLIDAVRRHALLILCVVFFANLLVLGYLMARNPSYTATAELLVEPNDKGFGDLEERLNFNGGQVQPSDMESEVRVLGSRKLALEVIERAGLREVAEPPGVSAKLAAQAQVVLSQVWDLTAGIRGSIASYVPSDGQLGTGGPDLREASAEESEDEVIQRFERNLRIRRDPLARVIQVDFTASSADLAAKVVNAVTAVYLEDRVNAQRDTLRQTASYMQDRLTILEKELEEAERRAKDYQSQTNLFDVEGGSVAQRRYGDLSRELTVANVQLADARARLGRGGSQVREVTSSPVIGELRKQEAELARRVADLASQYGQRHPQMLNARAELVDVRRSIDAETSRIVASLQNEVAVAEARVARLKAAADEAEGRLSNSGSSQVELRELERKADAARNVYAAMLDRYRRATEQQGVLSSGARVISEAAPPVRPSDPSKLLILGFTTIGSLGIGAGLAFLRELRRRGFEHSQDLEEAIGLPVLAVLPSLKSRGAPTPGEVHATSARMKMARTVYIEAVQRIATRLLVSNSAQGDGLGRIVAVTSSFPSEGKTTIALSVARQCARSGRRTLLIDADLRRRTVELMLGIEERRAGLVQLLRGETTDPADATVLDHISDLRVMPGCGTPETPMQLLSSPAMAKLLADLRTRYDVIVVDAPPVLAVSDVLALARHVDDMLFVVRWQRTPKDAVLAAVRELATVDVDFAGLVLNDVDVKSYSKYGRADHMYYSKQYGSYYHTGT